MFAGDCKAISSSQHSVYGIDNGRRSGSSLCQYPRFFLRARVQAAGRDLNIRETDYSATVFIGLDISTLGLALKGASHIYKYSQSNLIYLIN